MQSLEVSGAVRPIYGSLGVKTVKGRAVGSCLCEYVVSILSCPPHFYLVGWDCIVGTVTCCGLYGPGIETLWGQGVLRLSRLALGPSQTPIRWVPDYFRG